MNASELGPSIAVVGSGPSGCYTAQFLRKRWRDAEIVVFDRLNEPFGLIRYGVAPDHLGTKGIAKQFERLFTRDRVRFVGGTEIGTDITLDQIRAAFDVVVLATGLGADRTLGEPALDGVYGAGVLTRLVNGHPDERPDQVRIGSRTVNVGNGNVAIDLVRLLLTPADRLLALGVAPDVVAALTAGPIERIDVVGRSAAANAKFDVAMVRELAGLPDVRFTSDSAPGLPAGDDTDGKAGVVAELVASSPAAAGRTVAFHFGWVPDGLETSDSAATNHGGDAAGAVARVERIRLRPTHGGADTLVLGTDSVCTAIGFTEHHAAPVRRAALESELADLECGLLGEGLYCVGWFRRGPVGTIPANRADARMVANAIIADVEARGTTTKPGSAALSLQTSTKELS